MSNSPRVWGACALAALVLLCVPACGDARAERSPALTLGDSLVFNLSIDGALVGAFKGVEGLSIEQEVIEFQNGDDPLTRKRPGRVKYGDITLKRGYFIGSTLNDWIEDARTGRGVRKDISITLYDPDTKAVLRTFNCHDCFPTRWKMSSLDGKGNDVLTEEVVIAIEWFEEA